MCCGSPAPADRIFCLVYRSGCLLSCGCSSCVHAAIPETRSLSSHHQRCRSPRPPAASAVRHLACGTKLIFLLAFCRPPAKTKPQSRVSAVNEVMIRKCFTKWEPVVDVVIPASRFNGVSPGPRQLPRCWGFVHFPPTAEGERAAADAIKNLNGTTISELRVRAERTMRAWLPARVSAPFTACCCCCHLHSKFLI